MKTVLVQIAFSILVITPYFTELAAFSVDITRKSNFVLQVAKIRQQPHNILHLSSDTSAENNGNNSHTTRGDSNINYLDRTRFDNDQKPRRIVKKEKHKGEEDGDDDEKSKKERNFSAWGVEKLHSRHELNFPCTVYSVAQNCFHAISSTLYCRNKLDPNIASNAMAVSVNDKRPVGFAYWPEGRDVGRLGVEIDHARFLISDHVTGKRRQYVEVEGRALRRVVLLLASKLSQMPWAGLEDKSMSVDIDDDDDHHHQEQQQEENHYDITDKENKQTRPIALYFNTLNQALQASSELQLLQQIASRHNQDISMYQNIRILCLGQDTIPDDMIRKKKNNDKHRRKWGASRLLSSGTVDPKNGLVIIVQPSDFNFESKPPGPSYGTVQDLQKLLSRASVNQIPSIVISPRLTEQMVEEGTTGIEQSGYQKSSTYGGVEPPRGPTPWLLRDFIPPVYSWVGCALELAHRRPSPLAIKESLLQHDDSHYHHHDENDDTEMECTVSYYSRVTMTQSVMESGHPWHLYVVENNLKVNEYKVEKQKTDYQYVASTNPHSGRPSRELLRDVLSEYI